jgi:glycerate kinase
MPKIVLAPDKFKHTLSALRVCEIETEEILKVFPKMKVVACPMADGGEGTLDLLIQSLGLATVSVVVKGPLFRDIEAKYAVSTDGKKAYVEMSTASGLQLLAPSERNPLLTTTYGTGQLIEHALDEGAQSIHLFIGGSATNDGGMGMASALGYQFFNELGQLLLGRGADLIKLATINDTKIHSRLKHTHFIVSTDVKNILTGSSGAIMTYGAQKGADEAQLMILEKGMKHFDEIVNKQIGGDCAKLPGSGAAGGLGYGALVFLGARLQSGIDAMIDITGLQEEVKNADLIISGEGKLDEQSLAGKVIDGVGNLAKANDVAYGVICGAIELSESALHQQGIIAHQSLVEQSGSSERAMTEPERYLRQATRQFMLDWAAFQKDSET